MGNYLESWLNRKKTFFGYVLDFEYSFHMSYRQGFATLLMRAACKEVHEKLGITPLVLVGKYTSNLVYILFVYFLFLIIFVHSQRMRTLLRKTFFCNLVSPNKTR